MNTRWTSWLAVSLWTVSLILALCALILAYANSAGGELLTDFVLYFGVLTAVIGSMSTVGTLIATHRPGNPLGWIFLVGGLSYGVMITADEYARYITYTAPGALPEITLLFWLAAWAWVPAMFVPASFGILLFPTGRLPSRRWRPFAWLAAIGFMILIVAEMLSPGPLDPNGAYPQLTNPIGVRSIAGIFDTIVNYPEPGLFAIFAGVIASIFARLRVASAVERQQIKWFAYAATVPIAAFVVYIVLLALPSISFKTANIVGETIATVGITALPVAIGIAILRHNLYDIDHLINRTLVYGSLTVALGLSFVGSVMFFQLVLEPLTNGNDLSIAGSTLLIAALFRPIRGRMQEMVDRRFYRQKYDSERALRAFGFSARDAVDLDQLAGDLVAVVAATMQPEHVSVWLR